MIPCNEATINHLTLNLIRFNKEKSFVYNNLKLPCPRRGKYKEWLSENYIADNTRIIIEPNIVGLDVALGYENGHLYKAINALGLDITHIISEIETIPKILPIKKYIELRGILYIKNSKIVFGQRDVFCNYLSFLDVDVTKYSFSPNQILNSKKNYYQDLLALTALGFDVPLTAYTSYTSEIDLYLRSFKRNSLLSPFPCNGITLRINSRKLQKQLSTSKAFLNWSFFIEFSR